MQKKNAKNYKNCTYYIKEEENRLKEELLKKFKRTKYLKLICAVIIDLFGNASYLIPAIGESGDLLWGLFSGVFIFILFPNRKLTALGGALEEFIPGTDIIPTACIAWTLDYVKDSRETLSKFVRKRIGDEQLVEELLNSQH